MGGLDRSYVLAGAAPGLIGIADPRSDLAGRAKLAAFTVTGAVSDAAGDQFIDGILAAWTIGDVPGFRQRTEPGLHIRSVGRLDPAPPVQAEREGGFSSKI